MIKKQPHNQPPPDDPGKRFSQWEKVGEQDSVTAARKRAEAMRSIQKAMEHSDGKEDEINKESSDGKEDGTPKN